MLSASVTIDGAAFSAAEAGLMAPTLAGKVNAIAVLQGLLAEPKAWQSTQVPLVIEQPGFPDNLTLVPPQQVKQRKLSSVLGRAVLLHAIAHIEFNAINLALDMLYRFRNMPLDFYQDWLQVAHEEARHHDLLQQRLKILGHSYGDFPAHNGLWDVAVSHADDLLERLVYVPIVLEARGLDVTPAMQQRLLHVGDDESADVLTIILQEEVGHVAIALRWYAWVCQQRGLDEDATMTTMLSQTRRMLVRGPLNEAARRQAGFSEQQLAKLNELITQSA